MASAAGANKRAAGATLERGLRTTEAEWTFIDGPGRKVDTLRLSVDIRTGACRLARRTAGTKTFVVLREASVSPDAIQVETTERGCVAVTVPGVLVAAGMPDRAAGYARSPWVDALGPRAGCCELVVLRMA